MPQCEDKRPRAGRGRGTGKTTICILPEIKSREEKLFNTGERETAPFPVPRPLGRDRLPLGIMPYGIWPSAVAHLRYLATSRPAIQLERAQRQAAAADPGLEWDATQYRYRLKAKASPHPSLPAGAHTGPGGVESLSMATEGTGGDIQRDTYDEKPAGICHE